MWRFRGTKFASGETLIEALACAQEPIAEKYNSKDKLVKSVVCKKLLVRTAYKEAYDLKTVWTAPVVVRKALKSKGTEYAEVALKALGEPGSWKDYNPARWAMWYALQNDWTFAYAVFSNAAMAYANTSKGKGYRDLETMSAELEVIRLNPRS